MKHILVAGGDRRALALAKMLQTENWEVHTVGLTPGDEEQVHMVQADLILFPYPCSVRNGIVPCLTPSVLTAETVLNHASGNACVIGEKGLEEKDLKHSMRLLRYSDAGSFHKENAELSAEAAVFEAMLHSRTAIEKLPVLVTGYGMFGKALAEKLKAIRAEVWVAVRREKQRQQAENDGMKALLLSQVEEVLPRIRMILNTVPARIFDERLLESISADCTVLELASTPYGFDPELARKRGISFAVLPGLPAKYAPETAARILYSAVEELLGRCSE